MSFFCTHYGSQCVITEMLGADQLLLVFPVAVIFLYFWFAFHKIVSLTTHKLYFQVASWDQVRHLSVALRCVCWEEARGTPCTLDSILPQAPHLHPHEMGCLAAEGWIR